jgi:hypothetical protein
MELAKSLDPGKTPKTDKASIVADAIRVVTQLRTENSQLQQLNKFLEVDSFVAASKGGRQQERAVVLLSGLIPPPPLMQINSKRFSVSSGLDKSSM